MRVGLLALLAATAGADPKSFPDIRPPLESKVDAPFALPKGWVAAPAPKTKSAGQDQVWDVGPLDGQVIVYAGKVADADLESAAAKRHAERIRNRVAWGVKAQAGPPRESLQLGARHAVRWRDAMGSSLGPYNQLMTCAVVGGHLACVIFKGDSPEAENVTAMIFGSLKR